MYLFIIMLFYTWYCLTHTFCSAGAKNLNVCFNAVSWLLQGWQQPETRSKAEGHQCETLH